MGSSVNNSIKTDSRLRLALIHVCDLIKLIIYAFYFSSVFNYIFWSICLKYFNFSNIFHLFISCWYTKRNYNTTLTYENHLISGVCPEFMDCILHSPIQAFTLLVQAPFEYTTQLIIPSLHLSPKPLIVSFTLSIPRLITLPLVSLLSSSPLHSLSCPLILSLVCLINLSSHSVTYSHIHMRYTRPTIDTITLRIRGGKWKWPITLVVCHIAVP